MDKKTIAKTISVVLGPHTWLPILLLVFIFKTGLNDQQIKVLLPLIFILLVLIPISYLYLAPKFKWAKEWDLPEKKERIPFFVIITISSAITMLPVKYFGNQFLFTLIEILFVLMLINVLITYFWKISLHTGINTLGSILVNFLLGWELPILYITIPIIFWARRNLNKHTTTQLLAGIIVNALFLVFALYLVGYMKLW
ncbi:hypothetical protein HYV21_00725 [Candidatus Microgenomates bacterium]|nr:hypothetical protein [Candidatus Microgenomates bacterium]